MILYTNGCSNTYGFCKDSIHCTWPNIVLKSLVYPDHIKNYSLANTKQNIIPPKEELITGDILINEAMTGGGNDYIFHSTIESISKLLKYENKPDLVIIQWSGTNRKIHVKENGDELLIQPNQYPHYEIKWEPIGSKHTIHYAFMLQEFLKKNNINYLFFNYMAWDRRIKNYSVYSELDLDKWIDFGWGKEVLLKGIKDYIVESGLSCDESGHPDVNGSYWIGKHILDKLNQSILPITHFHKKMT